MNGWTDRQTDRQTDLCSQANTTLQNFHYSWHKSSQNLRINMRDALQGRMYHYITIPIHCHASPLSMTSSYQSDSLHHGRGLGGGYPQAVQLLLSLRLSSETESDGVELLGGCEGVRGGEVRGGVLCVYVCPSITWGSRELRDSSSVGTSNGMWGLRRGPWGMGV